MAETRSAPLCLPPWPLQRRPRTVLPAGACDCHFHVFREGLPLAPLIRKELQVARQSGDDNW